MQANPKVDFFFAKGKTWREEFLELRNIVLECGLTEELKWGVPCYTLEKKNVVLMHGFKEYCALLFVKGALLKDPKGILIQQTENVQAARQIRFTSLEQIVKLRATLKSYIKQAIDIEKSGAKVEFKSTSTYAVPEEFQQKLKAFPDLNTAFKALTPGRQRAYLLYFSAPKQSKTRETRIDNSIDKILNGKGLND